ncbi:MAG: hypothetical protein LBU30_00475, partial [Candidatus Methanoplasma sp.]|nr:hypothetical protein [Candidatus Methanoplasma sp.]
MPFIKERRMGVITLGISWIIVPVIAILMINSVYSVADVIIAIIISMVFHIIGVVYYSGYMEVIYGFKTMDSKY